MNYYFPTYFDFWICCIYLAQELGRRLIAVYSRDKPFSNWTVNDFPIFRHINICFSSGMPVSRSRGILFSYLLRFFPSKPLPPPHPFILGAFIIFSFSVKFFILPCPNEFNQFFAPILFQALYWKKFSGYFLAMNAFYDHNSSISQSFSVLIDCTQMYLSKDVFSKSDIRAEIVVILFLNFRGYSERSL